MQFTTDIFLFYGTPSLLSLQMSCTFRQIFYLNLDKVWKHKTMIQHIMWFPPYHFPHLRVIPTLRRAIFQCPPADSVTCDQVT